ncbi:MAG: diaminopimelate epimerase [Legionellaceae bacterium]|nr:diaminopimelate epimerase [Legionellaceae bacterium]MBP9774961.1 diaminopimelate epimerase [Legionellaceae bacterium]
MMISFTKMHGLGNDFMVVDATQHPLTLSPKQIAHLSNRHTGIGFDQCLIVETSTVPEVDFFYRIFNADGQEVGQCGNGARCLARFVQARGLSSKQELCIQTLKTKMYLTLHDDDTVTVHFAPPNLAPHLIPIQATQQETLYSLTIEEQTYSFHAINVGNPHAILLANHWTDADIATIGPQLSTHPCFPEQTNVGFLNILNPHHLQLRVYERGCGETLACGSGAVAAAAIGQLYHNMTHEIRVSLPGGDLQVSWPKRTGPLYLRGPATFVYDGNLGEDALCES